MKICLNTFSAIYEHLLLQIEILYLQMTFKSRCANTFYFGCNLLVLTTESNYQRSILTTFNKSDTLSPKYRPVTKTFCQTA